MALFLGNDCGDLLRSSDETNVLLPNNKLILYSEVSGSWLDVNYWLMHVNTSTHVISLYTHHISHMHMYIHTTHIHVHTQSTQLHTHR